MRATFRRAMWFVAHGPADVALTSPLRPVRLVRGVRRLVRGEAAPREERDYHHPWDNAPWFSPYRDR